GHRPLPRGAPDRRTVRARPSRSGRHHRRLLRPGRRGSQPFLRRRRGAARHIGLHGKTPRPVMTSLVPFEDFHRLPTGDPATATSWIFWHPRAGAYMLDATLEDERGRLAALTVANPELAWTSDALSMVSL